MISDNEIAALADAIIRYQDWQRQQAERAEQRRLARKMRRQHEQREAELSKDPEAA